MAFGSSWALCASSCSLHTLSLLCDFLGGLAILGLVLLLGDFFFDFIALGILLFSLDLLLSLLGLSLGLLALVVSFVSLLSCSLLFVFGSLFWGLLGLCFVVINIFALFLSLSSFIDFLSLSFFIHLGVILLSFAVCLWL